MFVGFIALESTLVSTVLVTNSSGTPVNADSLPTYRVYGPDGYVQAGTVSFRDSGSVTNASNATPIVITSSNHGLTTGATVTITGVNGNTAANGTFQVTKVDSNNFSLDGSAGSGPWTDSGTWNVTGLYKYSVAATATNGYAQGENYQALFSYQISSTNYGQIHSFMVE